MTADFGYCRYRWTTQEKDAFLTHKRVPRSGQHLPPSCELIPICFYTQHAECSHHGPMVRARQFRRLDSVAQPRLVAWDLGGFDHKYEMSAPVIIPTDDMLATAAQRATFQKALQSKTNTPLLSALLKTGKYPIEYAAQHSGPFPNHGDWHGVLELLDSFTLGKPFEHPKGLIRQPHDYKHTLQCIQQRQADQQMRSELDNEGIHVDIFEEEE